MEKSNKLLKRYTDARAHRNAALPKLENLDETLDILRNIHEEAKLGGGSAQHISACSNASLHIARILVGLDKANYSKVHSIYFASQEEWWKGKAPGVYPILSGFLNWSNSYKQQKG
jgi:DNA polymerase phi